MLPIYSKRSEKNMNRKIFEGFYKCPLGKIYSISENDTILGWIYKSQNSIGIIIENIYDVEINERFHSISIEKILLGVQGEIKNYIGIFCHNHNLYEQFSLMCEDFLYAERKQIQQNPYTWYEKWKLLTGDILSKKEIYDILAEILAYKYYSKIDNSMIWKIDEAKTHDIEGKYFDVEVKSTILKYKNEVQISSQHQLLPSQNKKLRLCFFKFEKSDHGISLDEAINLFDNDKKNEITKRLEKCNIYKGNKIFKEKYNILSINEYQVDEDFPKIDLSSFVDGKYPKHITKIEYTVELSGLDSYIIQPNEII